MLCILGFLGLVPASQKRQGSIATGSIMLGWALTYQLTVGTVCYSLVAEMSTRRLQIKTVRTTPGCEIDGRDGTAQQDRILTLLPTGRARSGPVHNRRYSMQRADTLHVEPRSLELEQFCGILLGEPRDFLFRVFRGLDQELLTLKRPVSASSASFIRIFGFPSLRDARLQNSICCSRKG